MDGNGLWVLLTEQRHVLLIQFRDLFEHAGFVHQLHGLELNQLRPQARAMRV